MDEHTEIHELGFEDFDESATWEGRPDPTINGWPFIPVDYGAIVTIGDSIEDMLTDAATGIPKREQEVNADGDSIADMRAVQDNLGVGSIDILMSRGWGRGKEKFVFRATCSDYRIAAKHADKFDASCMDAATFARAAIDAGDWIRIESPDGSVFWYRDMEGRRVVAPSGDGQCFSSWHRLIVSRRTPEQHAKETRPEPEPIPTLKWTTDLPTKPGWYYVAKYGEYVRVVQVAQMGLSKTALAVRGEGVSGHDVPVGNFGKSGYPLTTWAGPLPEPNPMV